MWATFTMKSQTDQQSPSQINCTQRKFPHLFIRLAKMSTIKLA